jgi:hypothetical protein
VKQVVEPVKQVEPVKTVKPTAAPTVSSISKRLDAARARAAKLPSAAARRMMNLDLDRLETRLKSGDSPRSLNRDLDEVVENYGGP